MQRGKGRGAHKVRNIGKVRDSFGHGFVPDEPTAAWNGLV